MAKEGEKLVLLDGSEATLKSDTLVIADESKALGLQVFLAVNTQVLIRKPKIFY